MAVKCSVVIYLMLANTVGLIFYMIGDLQPQSKD